MNLSYAQAVADSLIRQKALRDAMLASVPDSELEHKYKEAYNLLRNYHDSHLLGIKR